MNKSLSFFASALILVAASFGYASPSEVSFTAIATGIETNAPIEFAFAAKDSDRDYETLFLLEDDLGDLTKKIEALGIPRGQPYNPRECVFWPMGSEIKISPSLDQFIVDEKNDSLLPFVYTGGERDSADSPIAATNMPSAFFALYNCSQSILQWSQSFSQTEVYGRFRPKVTLKKGERIKFTIQREPQSSYTSLEQTLNSTNLLSVIETIKKTAEKGRVSLLVRFAPTLTLKEAVSMASLLSEIDSPRISINGYGKGEFFYRAYLPLEKWREPKERLLQPPELHIKSADQFDVTVIHEDWSSETSVDPILTAETKSFNSIEKAAHFAADQVGRTDTLLIFAPSSTPLKTLYAVRQAITRPILNWYIFSE